MTAEKVTVHRIGLAAFLRSLPKSGFMVGTETYLGARRGKFVTEGEIVDWVYGDRADGGPIYAANNIRQAVRRLRRRGIVIEGVPTRGYMIPMSDGQGA